MLLKWKIEWDLADGLAQKCCMQVGFSSHEIKVLSVFSASLNNGLFMLTRSK